MNKKKLITALAALVSGCLLLTATVAYGVIPFLTVHNTGWMGVVGIYWDTACTKPMTTIHWNTTVPDNSYNVTAWLKNFGSADVNLTMTTANWSPINASQYMTVSWDHPGSILHPGVEQAIITLFVHANATDSGISSFSFDLLINEGWS